MRKTLEKPDYRMSIPDLVGLKDKTTLLIDRDSTILAAYGIDLTTVTFLTDTTTELMNLPADIYLKGQVSVLTQLRDTTADKVRVAIRDIVLRPRLKFGENSAEYRSFGTAGMDNLDPMHLYFCASTVVQVAGLYLSQLTDQGLTQAMLDNLTALNATFHQAIIDKVKAVGLRDLYTEKRITIANLLYNRIVQICDVGKTYWFDKSEASYNDYVIYNTPTLKKPEPGQYGSIHGSVLRADNNEVPESSFVFIDGVEAPIVPDEDGDYEMDMVPVGNRHISATAEECEDFAGDVEIVADEDIEYNILIQPVESPPPG